MFGRKQASLSLHRSCSNPSSGPTTKLNQFINSKTAEKRLQFGTSKCIKLHVGQTCYAALCKDLYVDGWKTEVETDPVTGKCFQSEHYGGMEKIKVKQEQTYLGDEISADGKHGQKCES